MLVMMPIFAKMISIPQMVQDPESWKFYGLQMEMVFSLHPIYSIQTTALVYQPNDDGSLIEGIGDYFSTPQPKP